MADFCLKNHRNSKELLYNKDIRYIYQNNVRKL